MPRTTRSGVSAETVEDLIDLCGSQVEVARAFGVSRAHVCQCLRRARERRLAEEEGLDAESL